MNEQETENQRTLALTEEGHRKLSQLKEDGYFGEMRDAYRLAISLAMAEGLIADRATSRTRTYINVGSLDPDGILRDAITAYFQGREGPPYEVAERLGEAGVADLADRLERNPSFSELFAQPAALEGPASTNRPRDPSA